MMEADVAFAFAENQEQVDKLLEVRESVPGIAHIIYDDPRGPAPYDHRGLIGTAELLARGRRMGPRPPRRLGRAGAQAVAPATCR